MPPWILVGDQALNSQAFAMRRSDGDNLWKRLSCCPLNEERKFRAWMLPSLLSQHSGSVITMFGSVRDLDCCEDLAVYWPNSFQVNALSYFNQCGCSISELSRTWSRMKCRVTAISIVMIKISTEILQIEVLLMSAESTCLLGIEELWTIPFASQSLVYNNKLSMYFLYSAMITSHSHCRK